MLIETVNGGFDLASNLWTVRNLLVQLGIDQSILFPGWMGIRASIPIMLGAPSGSKQSSSEVPPGKPTSARDLKKDLKGKRKKDPAEQITVTGSLLPALLLSEGWWEGGLWDFTVEAQSVQAHEPHRNVQDWLYSGFKSWAPSWDLSEEDTAGTVSRYMFAQIGEGDEADSIPVVIGPKWAVKVREMLGKSLTMSVEAKGRLYHFDDIPMLHEGLPKRALSQLSKTAALKYFILVDDNNPHHGVKHIGWSNLYSGYLWQCWVRAPERDLALSGRIPVQSTYFIWEHTNLADIDSIKFNYASLEFKRAYFEKELGLGQMLLLQQSFPVHDIVGSVQTKPLMSTTQFNEFLSHTREAMLRD